MSDFIKRISPIDSETFVPVYGALQKTDTPKMGGDERDPYGDDSYRRTRSGGVGPVGAKIATNEAGYCYAGRPTFRMTSDETRAEAREIAERRRKLCALYPLPTEAAA